MRNIARESTNLRRADEVLVVENPDGIFVASIKNKPSWRAEGSTAAEAESKLLDLLEMQSESSEMLHKHDVLADPDEVATPEEE